MLRVVGTGGAGDPRLADAHRRVRRGVPVHDRPGDHRRRCPGVGAAGDVHRRARLGDLRQHRTTASALWSRLVDVGQRPRPAPGRLPRDRVAAARARLPGVGLRPDPGDQPARGRARLLRQARQARRFRRRRRAARGQGRRSLPAAVLPGARRPAVRRTRRGAGQRRGSGRRAGDLRRVRLHGRALDRVRLPADRVSTVRVRRSASTCSASRSARPWSPRSSSGQGTGMALPIPDRVLRCTITSGGRRAAPHPHRPPCAR